jgi:hypothetical protein
MQATWQKVPIIGQPYENVEEVELDGMNATVQDGYVNEMDHIVKRPGLTEFVDLGTSLPVDGLYWWDEQNVVIAVSNKRVWKISVQDGTKTELTGSTALLAGGIVTFATDGTVLVMANGAQMVHTDGSTLTTMADAQAPTAVTHVAFLDRYILAMSSTQINFSAVGDYSNWTALDFFLAEGQPDNNIAMMEGFREIIVLGRRSVEFFYNDGQTPFSRLAGSSQPYGCSAPNSLCQVGSTWIWLDQNRRLVSMTGRQVTPVSNPYERVIQRYVNVDDAVGYTIGVDGYPLYILNFPTTRQTLVYNYQTQKWSKWGYWNTTTGTYERFRGQSYCYARKWNFHLIGDWQNGKIYKADRSTFTDNSNAIRTVVRTGHISHGTETNKRSAVIRLRVKRGLANSSESDPQLTMRRRVNNGAQFENERWASLGQAGQHELHLEWRRNGTYRTVQYEFVHSDNSDFVLVGAEELIETLGR